MRKIKKLFIMLIILSIYTTIVVAEDPGNDTIPVSTPSVTEEMTYTPTATVTDASIPVDISTPSDIDTGTVADTQPGQTPTTITTEKIEQKFRVGPTVRIRPLNDIINQDQDGLVELYMDNPSLNDISLSVDARISVPSSIHVYGQSFGEAGAAGMVYGKFEIPPGTARTINIVIKAEKIGDFSAQFSGIYWPGENKDAYQQISLTHPFRVNAPSKDPLKDTSGGTSNDGESENAQEKSPGISIIVALSIITIMAYILKRKP